MKQAALRVTIIRPEGFLMLKRGLMLAFLFVVTLMMTSQWSSSQDSEEQGAIPAYNARPPAKGTKLRVSMKLFTRVMRRAV